MVLLDFIRFTNPNNGEINAGLTIKIISKRDVTERIKGITTDNASDICIAHNNLKKISFMLENTTQTLE